MENKRSYSIHFYILMFIFTSSIFVFQNCGTPFYINGVAVNSSIDDEDILNGRKLYTQHCSSCHQPVETSTVKNASPSDIFAAIINQPTMSSLSILSDQEVSNISKTLNFDLNIALGKQGVDVLPTIGNRRFMASSFTYIFNSSNDSNVDFAIQKNIIGMHKHPTDGYTMQNYGRPESYGGPCRRTDAYCPSRENINSRGSSGNDDYSVVSAPVLAPASAIRKGFQDIACAEVLSRDSAVSSAMGRVNLNTSSPVSADHISRVFNLFFPGREPSSSSMDSVLSLYNGAKDKGMSSKDSWKFVLFAMCTSAGMDKL